MQSKFTSLEILHRGTYTMKNVFKSCSQTAAFLLLLPLICFGQGNSNNQVSPDLADMIVANAANPGAIRDVIVRFSTPPPPDQIANINAAANANANPNG